MLFSSAFDLLNHTHFLRQVPEDDLRALAATLTQEKFDAGAVILHQGSRANAMYFIAEGEVEIVRKHLDRDEEQLAKLKAGDTFGEVEMVYTQTRFASVQATQDTTVYRWDRLAMTDFMKKNPAALSSLRFAAQSRRLARKLRFDWLAEDEMIYGLARKHNVLLYQALTLPMLLGGAAVLLIAWGLVENQSILAWVGTGMMVFAIALTVWRWADWRNDYYIVTNRRAVWLEKIIGIYDSRVEAPLHMVLSVSVSTEMVGRIMDYGDVIIRTYTGKVVFRNVENPAAMAAIVEEHWHRLRAQQEQTDHESLRSAVRHRFAPQSPAEEIESEAEDSPPPDKPKPKRKLLGLSFQVRYQDKDAITYRKHWAVLLREIAAPTFLILVSLGILSGQVLGWFDLLPTNSLLPIVILLMIALSGWWIYRYVDWANDIYQVTPEQIVDVYKKPLSREVRKVAPLENVLSTEVDRKGLVGILMNYGDVIANVGTALFTFEGVFDPAGVQQDIVHAQEALIQSKRDKERKQRQDEMVELLEIYHDEYANSDKLLKSEDDQNNDHP